MLVGQGYLEHHTDAALRDFMVCYQPKNLVSFCYTTKIMFKSLSDKTKVAGIFWQLNQLHFG
jgi:hypothetical protein